jgi:hypothetical protein
LRRSGSLRRRIIAMRKFLHIVLLGWFANVALAQPAPYTDGAGNPACQPFVVYNAWTNSIVLAFADQNGNWPNVVVPQGQAFHGLTSVNGMYLWDYSTYLYVIRQQNGSLDFSAGNGAPYADTLTGDGTTNGVFFMATLYPLDTSVQDGNGNELYNPGANIYQGPDVLYQLNYSQVQVSSSFYIPTAWQCFRFWASGVGTALFFALIGSSRRMLGRVHEVNTDL